MIELFKDATGWRWHLVTANGKVIATSGEGYVKRSAAIKAVERVKVVLPGAGLVERLA